MSQGGRLARTLQRIGCPKAKEFTAESLEWLFENQACLPFLEWFCDNISAENVLTDDEIKRYDELVSSGEGMLEGEQLNEALSLAQETEDRPIDSLREEIASTKRRVEVMNKRLQKLVFQRNKLSLHQSLCAHQLSQISEVEKEAKKTYKKYLELSQVDSNQMDATIYDLQQTVCELTELYAQQGELQRNNKVFLSQLSFDDYFESEEKFTSDITMYTKKQFFEGIADMAGRGDKTRYDLLEISDPTSLLIRGESEDVTLNDCKELARLQSVFALSESKRINAEATTVGVKSALSLAKEKKRAMLRHHHIDDIDILRDRLNETQTSLTVVKDEIQKLTENTLPILIHELAELQATKILRGDYDLKIARQDYFTSKQDQVTNQLLLQRSRYEFLSMTLEVEAHKHRDTHRLFSAVQSGLQNLSESQVNRIVSFQ